MATTASRLRRPFRMLLPVALAALVVGGVASEVSGNHGGRPIGALFGCDRPVTPPRCTSVGDNPRHLVHFDESLTEELATSLRATMAEDYGATKLILVEQPRLTRMTDVIAFSRDYGDNGAAGWVYCPIGAPQGTNPNGARWCRHQELHLNINARYGAFFSDAASRDHITCHELGHTLGLRHWGNPPQTSGPDVGATCMNANTPDGPTTLHQFDVDHINGYAYRQGPPRRHVPIEASDDVPRTRLLPWTGSLHATQVDDPASLGDLTRSSDAVVRGEIVAVAPGRVFGDPEGDALHYAAATLRVDELVAGSLPDAHTAQLTLEIPLFDGPGSISSLPAWGEAVFFLRNKAESARIAGVSAHEVVGEGEFYRLLIFGGLVANDEGRALTDPEVPALADVAGLSFEQAVEVVRRAAR